MMQHWFTADPHFGHANIISYCNRPFRNLDEMHKKLIRNWNECVKPDDTIYIIGDFCFRNLQNRGEGEAMNAAGYAAMLNGHKVFLKGNHDNNNSCKTIIQNMTIQYMGHTIFMTHRPEDANLSYKINLVGHVHEKFKTKLIRDTALQRESIITNVGVDVWNYRPVTLKTIMKSWRKL